MVTEPILFDAVWTCMLDGTAMCSGPCFFCDFVFDASDDAADEYWMEAIVLLDGDERVDSRNWKCYGLYKQDSLKQIWQPCVTTQCGRDEKAALGPRRRRRFGDNGHWHQYTCCLQRLVGRQLLTMMLLILLVKMPWRKLLQGPMMGSKLWWNLGLNPSLNSLHYLSDQSQIRLYFISFLVRENWLMRRWWIICHIQQKSINSAVWKWFGVFLWRRVPQPAGHPQLLLGDWHSPPTHHAAYPLCSHNNAHPPMNNHTRSVQPQQAEPVEAHGRAIYKTYNSPHGCGYRDYKFVHACSYSGCSQNHPATVVHIQD